MQDTNIWHQQTRAAQAIKALQANNFQADFVTSRAELADKLTEIIQPGWSVGFGGSMTVKELAVAELLATRGHQLWDHSQAGLSAEQSLAIRRRQLTADCFICSSNAITLDGKLVNIDGVGNRVAAMSFGPQQVIVIAGINKLVLDIEAGLKRIQQIVAPMHAKRLNKATPCAQTGICVNCKSPARICRITQVLTKKPSAVEFTVLLINENLGF